MKINFVRSSVLPLVLATARALVSGCAIPNLQEARNYGG